MVFARSKGMMMSVRVQDSCYFCHESLLDAKMVWVCKSCGTSWHDAHKKTHFKWNAWSGLKNGICPNCGHSLKDNVEILLKFSDWQEKLGEDSAVPKLAVAQPADLSLPATAIDDPQQALPSFTASAPLNNKPKKKSIIGSVLLLIPFAAIAIFGVVSLFTMWDEGFYWILAALTFISFGGRIAFASIKDIQDYFKQKNK